MGRKWSRCGLTWPRDPPFVGLSVPERRHKVARVLTTVLLVFLVAIPVEAMPVLAKSHGENHSKLVPNCLALRSSRATVVAGGSGGILRSCGGSAALTVGESVRFRPFFTLPAGYTDVKIENDDIGSTHWDYGSVVVSDHPVDIVERGGCQYCAAYVY